MITRSKSNTANISNSENDCNKDTGEKARLRQRSRGHMVAVTGSLHIMYWNPLFK